MQPTGMEVLERAIEEITGVARECGLDFFPLRYEVCPADVIYTVGAYGMPTRFTHWSFGKAFHRMKTQYDYNLSRIYELVINSDPCYAFLLEGNSLVQNKLIAAHVLAHCDFFKNNVRFSTTPRDMVERMAVSAGRIRGYESRFGQGEVEKFLDAAMAVQEHVEFSIVPAVKSRARVSPGEPAVPGRSKSDKYQDLLDLDGWPAPSPEDTLREEERRNLSPKKDLVRFIMEHSQALKPWQRDIMAILREEMLYFWPQLETKVMNEGWASFWHLEIMRRLDLTEAETIEFARLNAGILQPSRAHINPYLLGLQIFKDLERRWGRDKIFEVRETESDISFLRNYLTKELVEEMDLYLYQRVDDTWQVVDKDWERVRERLVAARVNGGYPYLVVIGGDYKRNGELYLRHEYEGVELDLKYLERTMPYIYRLWGRPVHLETVVGGSDVLYSCSGETCSSRRM
ncbi:stage V sporulation protein R [Clostridiales bacterium PH28_bin88]|nr:stage V sporulation protein R [Clostridiales bacterium PH28_bin88]